MLVTNSPSQIPVRRIPTFKTKFDEEFTEVNILPAYQIVMPDRSKPRNTRMIFLIASPRFSLFSVRSMMAKVTTGPIKLRDVRTRNNPPVAK